MLLYCSELVENFLLKNNEQLIDGLRAGIPACCTVAGIKQSSGKPRDTIVKPTLNCAAIPGQHLCMFSSVNSYKHCF